MKKGRVRGGMKKGKDGQKPQSSRSSSATLVC